jgi:hypothetical protein
MKFQNPYDELIHPDGTIWKITRRWEGNRIMADESDERKNFKYNGIENETFPKSENISCRRLSFSFFASLFFHIRLARFANSSFLWALFSQSTIDNLLDFSNSEECKCAWETL